MSNILDSKDYNDPNSVLYRVVLKNNILDIQNESRTDNQNLSYFNLKVEIVKGDKKDYGIKKIVFTKLSNKKGKNDEEIEALIAGGKIMNLPSLEAMTKVEALYKYAKEGGNEEGYVVAKDGTISSKKTSEYNNEVELTELYREIVNKGKTPAFDIHTHPIKFLENGGIDDTQIGVAYPSGTIGGTEKDFGHVEKLKQQGYNSEPCWVLGFFLDINRSEPYPLLPRINFYTSDWVYVPKQSELIIRPPANVIGGEIKKTTTDQGYPFFDFKKAINKIRNA